jgi:hypothetical protein
VGGISLACCLDGFIWLIHIPSFVMIGSDILKLLGDGYAYGHMQTLTDRKMIP